MKKGDPPRRSFILKSFAPPTHQCQRFHGRGLAQVGLGKSKRPTSAFAQALRIDIHDVTALLPTSESCL